MRALELFQKVLGLIPTWQVEVSEFIPDRKRLGIMIHLIGGKIKSMGNKE